MSNNYKFLYSFLCLFCFIFSNSALAKDDPLLLGNYARQLLDIQKWDETYEKQRNKDINYLLGNISEKSLTNLTAAQKDQLISLMRNMAINQLLKDKSYFKGYLINQYSSAFTQDEFNSLIAYNNTDLMKMIITAKLNNTELKIEEINIKLNSQTAADKKITEWFNNSYLNDRYARFQEVMTPKLNKMIYERTKDILKAVFNQMPDLQKIITK
jgi:hypothetical protein